MTRRRKDPLRELTPEEEKTCRAIISRGQNKAEVTRRAYILLKSHGPGDSG